MASGSADSKNVAPVGMMLPDFAEHEELLPPQLLIGAERDFI